MEYILDTACIADIRHCNEFYPISGVTTNPSIIAKENRDFWAILKDIRDVIGPDKILFAQTIRKTADGIVEEAKLLNERAGGEFGVKIPIGEEGLKATMALKKLGIKVLMTAIFTPAQALVAARAAPTTSRRTSTVWTTFPAAAPRSSRRSWRRSPSTDCPARSWRRASKTSNRSRAVPRRAVTA